MNTKRGDNSLAFVILHKFARAATGVRAAHFQYTTSQPICQAKNTKKINKFFFLKPIDKAASMCYNTDRN